MLIKAGKLNLRKRNGRRLAHRPRHEKRDAPCRFEVLLHSLGKVAGFIIRADSACQ